MPGQLVSIMRTSPSSVGRMAADHRLSPLSLRWEEGTRGWVLFPTVFFIGEENPSWDSPVGLLLHCFHHPVGHMPSPRVYPEL